MSGDTRKRYELLVDSETDDAARFIFLKYKCKTMSDVYRVSVKMMARWLGFDLSDDAS